MLRLVESAEDQTDFQSRLESEFDLELLDEALARVRLRVEPPTWEAFSATAIDGLAAGQVARRLGLAITAVYKAKSRIQKLLREELALLNRIDECDAIQELPH